jgi:hypothetical protein
MIKLKLQKFYLKQTNIKVVVDGTTMSIELTRKDLNKPYVGNKAGLEFIYVED